MGRGNNKNGKFSAKGIFITATDTDAGKTVVTAGLARNFYKKQYLVDIIKPIATGGIPCPDTFFLSHAVDGTISPEKIAPFSLENPLAPYTILRRKNVSVNIKKIFCEIKQRESLCEFFFIEGIGGILVPCLKYYSVIDFIVELQYPVLVVARAGLGTINHSLMTLSLLKSRKVNVLGFVTNCCKPYANDESLADNALIIAELSGFDWLGNVPYIKNVSDDFSELETVFEKIACKFKEKIR